MEFTAVTYVLATQHSSAANNDRLNYFFTSCIPIPKQQILTRETQTVQLNLYSNKRNKRKTSHFNTHFSVNNGKKKMQ